MRINELMIGSHVQMNNFSNGKVVACEQNGVVSVRLRDGSVVKEDVSRLKPIPISSSWLIKNGFTYYNLGKGGRYLCDVKVEEQFYTFRVEELFRYRGVTSWAFSVEDGDCDMRVNMVTMYVHQIQGLVGLLGFSFNAQWVN